MDDGQSLKLYISAGAEEQNITSLFNTNKITKGQ
jgi:hypothetical protein